MIARLWGGRATSARADAYYRHFVNTVAPGLAAVAGHRGAYLLRRERDGQVEFLAVTLWDSLEAVRGFAGPDAEKAVVEPEGKAALTGFDELASHYDVVHVGMQSG